MARKRTAAGEISRAAFEQQMELAGKIMDKDRVVLRALALGDQHPDADVNTLLEIAREQATNRSA
jgi:hypothetical protein